MHDMKTRPCIVSESETTSEWNWKVIRDGEAVEYSNCYLESSYTYSKIDVDKCLPFEVAHHDPR